jgi:hypothetical protein
MMDYGNMVRQLMMQATPVANKNSPLSMNPNPLGATEGAGAMGAGGGGRMYHAVRPQNEGRDGMWLAPNQQMAKDYGPNVKAFDLPKGLRLATPDDRARIREGNGIDGLKAQGFHGLRMDDGSVFLFDRSLIR